MNILCSLIPQQEWTVTTILTHIGLTLGFILALVLISKIVRQGHRSPSSTIAWLLVIILAPWLGVPLYLMLGGRKMRRRAGRKRQLHLNRETIIPVAISIGPVSPDRVFQVMSVLRVIFQFYFR